MYNILLADDDYFFRNIVQKHYTQMSQYNIIAVSDGENALSVLKSGSVNAAILDYHLPLKRADRILCEMKTAKVNVPVIIVTGDRADDTERIIKLYNTEYFLVKPLKLAELDMALYELMRKKQFADVFAGGV